MNSILVKLKKTVKDIKPLNGANCAPYVKKNGADQSMVKSLFTDLNVPFCRLHDVVGEFGGSYYIDVPNIFKDFDADENDESNYDFYFSDEYIKAIVDSGTKVYYRLGVTIEWGSKQYASNPPKDFNKWARICERIIAHYNKGWANGFHYNIEYWEIWNEPENPPMWTGMKEQFFDLYRVSSKYLKDKFPEIKIGGYGSCGFYATTSRPNSPFFKTVLNYFYDFIKMVKDENLPLDFFSWHIYTPEIEELLSHAKFVREYLDKNGLIKTESHLNEWNVGGEGGGFHLMRNMIGASYILATLFALQSNDNVDKAMYYVMSNNAGYNGLFDRNSNAKTCTYFALKEFSEIVELGKQVEVLNDNNGIYCLCATNGNKYKIVVINRNGEEREITVKLEGLTTPVKVNRYEITENDFRFNEKNIYLNNFDLLTFNVGQNGIMVFNLGEYYVSEKTS